MEAFDDNQHRFKSGETVHRGCQQHPPTLSSKELDLVWAQCALTCSSQLQKKKSVLIQLRKYSTSPVFKPTSRTQGSLSYKKEICFSRLINFQL